MWQFIRGLLVRARSAEFEATLKSLAKNAKIKKKFKIRNSPIKAGQANREIGLKWEKAGEESHVCLHTILFTLEV